MTRKILIVAECWEGEITNASLEAIGLAEMLADMNHFSLCMAILGNEIDDLASDISAKTGIEVLYISGKSYEYYTPDVYCEILAQIIRDASPILVILCHSHQSIDFAPRLASILHRPLISNCIDLHLESDQIVVRRCVYGGKLNQEMRFKYRPPNLITIQRGRFKKSKLAGTGSPNVARLNLSPSDMNISGRKVLEIKRGILGRIDLTKAKIIVAGGRGLGSKDNFGIIFDLAEVLEASVGASRPVIDSGWLSKDYQVGISGQLVAPSVYIACGISGDIHHLTGIVNASCIVAINKDPHAPIFGVADYGIVGDLFDVVPAITQAVKETGNIPGMNC